MADNEKIVVKDAEEVRSKITDYMSSNESIKKKMMASEKELDSFAEFTNTILQQISALLEKPMNLPTAATRDSLESPESLTSAILYV